MAKSSNWTKKLLEYAPDIAGAILSGGTTLPSLAIKAFRDATGTDVQTQADVQMAVEGMTPDMQLKLTSANNMFKIEMKRLGLELDSNELLDKQDAREHNKHSVMPAAICIVLTLMIAMSGYLIFAHQIPDQNTEIAYLLFGALITKWGDSIAYWVGTTRSSANKTIQSTMDKFK
tara:strand:+ start:14803 stop:15327 length:525 start_codon:yes stop_codon:yes gene_type:complete